MTKVHLCLLHFSLFNPSIFFPFSYLSVFFMYMDTLYTVSIQAVRYPPNPIHS
jgi:hypothetical protein